MAQAANRSGDIDMATTYTPAAPFGAIAIHRATNAVSEMFVAVREWNNTRRTLAALNGLNADLLDDIGLTPGDIGRKSF